MNEDAADAFVARFTVDPVGIGPLDGRTLCVKDLYDIAGHVSGTGNPAWAACETPARGHAPAVRRLLEAGATLVGKTQTDEFAYSLMGVNAHYGTPVNPAAPDRVPGGSSSGSASAVAAGEADIGLGTDTGASVRIPASFCGLFGVRPTHGRIPSDGIVPLAPSFDTVGWLTRDAATLAMVGDVFGLGNADAWTPRRLVIAQDLWARAGDATRDALAPAVARLEAVLGPAEAVDLAPSGGPDRWREIFNVCQAAEAWRAHGAWIEAVRPTLGPGVRERFARAASVTAEAWEAARRDREAVTAHLDQLIPADVVVLLPTAPGPAPLRTTPESALDAYRADVLALSCVAPLTGRPQLSVPTGTVDGAPVGLSLLGPRNGDRGLLTLCREVFG